ncbi:MAG: hypothetical protein IK017_05265 [Paludibacteraceae bacterium]|nr:hypothetical protein [Paludibacteraceae bacterium]MBR5972046.1 hypothetical protein [Paludibacteraceae bacterium]
MSQISDLILKQVQEAASQSASQSDLGSNVLDGLSDSILNSLKQTAKSPNGIEQLTSLFTGNTSAESSPITQLASQIFSSQVAPKLGLSASSANAAAGLLPTIIAGLVSIITKKGSGIDLSSILSSLGAVASSNPTTGKLISIIGRLGGLLKKRK